MGGCEPDRLLAGRYRLHAVIGQGGMGAVWRARDELLNRDVAVKEIIWPPQMGPVERETARRRAVREAQMAARLRHPNIVGVYDIVEEDDRPSIVMELVPFRSLRDVMAEDGLLSPAEAARVGLGVLAALRATHEAGIVHRDVKPANILLGPEGRVVLTDFGIAKAADSPALTTSGVLIGSPSYTAPERALGGRAGAAADLWALGASLYAAVEGRPPFERNGALASLTAVVEGDFDPPTRAGPLLEVINGLLRKDPEERLKLTEAERMLHRAAQEDGAGGDDAGTSGSAGESPDEGSAAVDRADGDGAAGDGAGGLASPGDAPAPEPPVVSDPEPAIPWDEPALPWQGRQSREGRSRRVRGAAVAVAVLAATVIAVGFALVTARPSGRHAAPRPEAKAPSATSGAASRPAASSPATSSRATGAAGSPTATPAGSGPTASAVPAGYYRFVNSTGFSIAVPNGWQISHVGHYVYIRDPANSGIFLLIDQSDQPKPDPLADWEQQAAAREGTYPGYHLVLLQAVRYPQAEKAADWEFTYDRSGIEVEVLNRNVLANARHAYALYWSTPVSDWSAYYHYFVTFAATFRPALDQA